MRRKSTANGRVSWAKKFRPTFYGFMFLRMVSGSRPCATGSLAIVSFRQGCMKPRPGPATVGASFLVSWRPPMAQSFPAAAPDPELAEAASALTRWRAARPLGGRIPEVLWSRAVELAARHGVAQVARALRLDYVRLKRRLAIKAEATAPSPPGFLDLTLELPPAGSADFTPGKSADFGR